MCDASHLTRFVSNEIFYLYISDVLCINGFFLALYTDFVLDYAKGSLKGLPSRPRRNTDSFRRGSKSVVLSRGGQVLLQPSGEPTRDNNIGITSQFFRAIV